MRRLPIARRLRPPNRKRTRLQSRFLVTVGLLVVLPMVAILAWRLGVLRGQLTRLVGSRHRAEAVQVARGFSVVLDALAGRVEVLGAIPDVAELARLASDRAATRPRTESSAAPGGGDAFEIERAAVTRVLRSIRLGASGTLTGLDLADRSGEIIASSDDDWFAGRPISDWRAASRALEGMRVFGRASSNALSDVPDLSISVPVYARDGERIEASILGVLQARVPAVDLLRLLASEPGEESPRIGLLTHDGRLMTSAHAAPIQLPQSLVWELRSDEPAFRTLAIPGMDGLQAVGAAWVSAPRPTDLGLGLTALVCYPETSALVIVSEGLTSFLGFNVAIVAVLAGAVSWVARSIVRPVRRLRDRVDSLRAGERILPDVPRTNDDVEDLAESFEQLVEDLQSTNDDLLRARSELEHRVEERTRDLARSEQELRSVLESAQDGILSLDAAGSIRSANAAAAWILRLGVKEIVGRRFDDLFRCKQDGGSRSAFERVRGDRTGAASLAATRGDGIEIPIEATLGELRSADGLYTSIFRDTSERERMERMKSSFVSTVSHELRTPLTSIRGALGLMAGGACGDVPAKAGSMIQIGIQNADRLIRLVHDLLDIEKLDGGKVRLRILPISLADAAQKTVEGIESVARTAGVRVDVEVQAVPVLADQDRVIQVMTNLLGNALKFSPVGSSVELRSRDLSEDEVEVSIRDHGPGIPEEFLGRIFGRFEQADSGDARAKGGTGLGLAISKGIVEEHGGRIGVRSREGEGACFWFTLRKAPAAVTAPRS